MATTKGKRIKKPSDTARKLPTVDRTVFNDETESVVHEPIEGLEGLELLLAEYDNQHRLAKHWEERRTDTKNELIGGMRASKLTEVKAETVNEKLTGKYIVSERHIIDPDKLKKAVGVKVWRKITTPQLDEDKLEAAITLGEVDPNVVASCSSTTQSEQVRVYRKTK